MITEREFRKIGVLGGVYNNFLALEETIADARARGIERLFCLGDLGGFGPLPDRVFPILFENQVEVLQGNYEYAIGHDEPDCGCGYTNPMDNHYAQLSYDYTREHTDASYKRWMRTLPSSIRIRLGEYRVLMCHGSPRRTNEFLWESTTSDGFLKRLFCEYDADLILATHTGIKWHRTVTIADNKRNGDGSEISEKIFVNVGVIGRPENDGRMNVWYTVLEATEDELQIEFVPVRYDHEQLADLMAEESLPEEFVETILTGWWTTCLEQLPEKERLRGRY
ncbi:MAG: metallophosphoesterase family protein [Candidatus Bipolaricaulia bacterium]